MSDMQLRVMPTSAVISPWSLEAGGRAMVGQNGPLSGLTSGTTDVNDQAVFYPFTITDWTTAYQLLFWVATGAGNFDVGIYDGQGNRIVSAGSTAMSATANTIQEINITDTVLPPGDYFLAVVVDNGGGTFYRLGLADEITLASNVVYEMASALPLPSTATMVVSTSTGPRIAAVGIQTRPVF